MDKILSESYFSSLSKVYGFCLINAVASPYAP